MKQGRIILLGVGVLVVGAAYFGLAIYPDRQLRSQLDAAIAQLPPGVEVTYGAAHYSLFNKTATIENLSLKAGKPSPWASAIAKVQIVNPSASFQEEWSRAAANPASVTPELALPLADTIAVDGVSAEISGFTVQIGSSAIQGVRIYPWALLQAGLPKLTDVAILVPAPQPQADPMAQIAPMLPLLRLESAVLLAEGFNSGFMKDLHVEGAMPPMPGRPAGRMDITIADYHSQGFDRGRYSHDEMDKMVEQMGNQGAASFDRVSLIGLDLRRPAEKFIKGEAPSMAMLDGLTIGSMIYDGFKVTLPTGQPIAIGSFFISDIVFADGAPASGRFGVTGLKVTAAMTPAPSAARAFKLLGIDTMTMSFGAGFSLDVPKGTVTLHDTAFAIDELGALKLTADISGISVSDIEAGNYPAAFAEATLNGAVLRFDDSSLIDRLLRGVATQNHGDPEAVRGAFEATAEQQVGALGDSPAIAASGRAIAAFIAAPRSLVIAASPPSPLPLTMLAAAKALPPSQLIQLLGLTVTANQ